MKRMTYVKALMCLLFPSAALVTRAQHPVAGDLKLLLSAKTQKGINIPPEAL